MTEKKKPLVVIGLTAQNVKRLKAIRIKPDGAPVVIVGGKNEQGKSALLDSIMYALGGPRTYDDEPVRRGQKKLDVEVDFGELVVTRTATAKGGGGVKIKFRDGLKPPGTTQAILDELYGGKHGLIFDPLKLMALAPAKRREILMDLVGLDFAAKDAQRRALFDERTSVNRAVKEATALCERLPLYDEAPAEEVSVAALSAEIEAALETQRAAEDAAREPDILRRDFEEARRSVANVEESFRQLRAKIRENQAHAKRLQDEIVEAEARAAGTAGVAVDPAPLRAQIEAADETNRQVRANAAWHAAETEMQDRQTQADVLTGRIGVIDEEKAEALGAAEFPIAGLGCDDDDITIGGFAFGQASQAQQIRAAMAIAFAREPRIRVGLIRNASLLDSKSLQLVAEIAAEYEAQTWLEVVSEKGEGCSVLIEDGEVK